MLNLILFVALIYDVLRLKSFMIQQCSVNQQYCGRVISPPWKQQDTKYRVEKTQLLSNKVHFVFPKERTSPIRGQCKCTARQVLHQIKLLLLLNFRINIRLLMHTYVFFFYCFLHLYMYVCMYTYMYTCNT